MHNKNCLSYWFPRLQVAGVPVPRTEIVRTDCRLIHLLDGKTPDGYLPFLDELGAACRKVGWPAFLRTGQGSGKHEWQHTCFLEHVGDLGSHVARLVNWSECVDFLGLDYTVWAAREFLKLDVAFTLPGYDGMPLAREFRCFVRDGSVQCCHPYWPLNAVERGRPDDSNWQLKYAEISRLVDDDLAAVLVLAGTVARAFAGDGGWSVDCCKTADGRWLVTDMAVAERSWHWPECPHAPSNV